MARKPFRAVEKPILEDGRLGCLPSAEMCVECPLSKASTPGFLGGYTTAQYIEILHSRADIACHLSPGFKTGDRLRQRSCTGVAMYRANTNCLPTGHALDAMLLIGTSGKAFGSPREFVLHHDAGYRMELMRGLSDARAFEQCAMELAKKNADAQEIDRVAIARGFNPLDIGAFIDAGRRNGLID